LTYGLIVEGPYDAAVYEELLRKAVPAIAQLVSRPVGGKTQLLNKLLGFLRDLEHVVNGAPVDKVLVVRDANGKDPAQLEKTLTDRIQGKVFTFPHAIQFHAVRRSVEAWLLADTAALNEVAAARGGRPISDVHEELRKSRIPKEDSFAFSRAQASRSIRQCVGKSRHERDWKSSGIGARRFALSSKKSWTVSSWISHPLLKVTPGQVD
jgi:hypothetical protein